MTDLLKGVAGVFSEDELKAKLNLGRPLVVKLGIDPTASEIHLGHCVVLRKLRQFQDLGHKAELIIGEFTALVGDPTGRDVTRPVLTRKEIRANADAFLRQAEKILDVSVGKFRMLSNFEWFGDMTVADFMENVAGCFTAQQLWHRESFRNRAEKGVEVSLQEFLYPTLQAFDSVKVSADIELGGTDQTFNLQRGRDIQSKNGLEPQVVITMPLLRGLDGNQKMSKSLGNHVGVMDEPNDMFGKIMSIPDSLMLEWFELLTDLSEDVHQMLKFMHPKEAKERLAWEIVKDFHSAEEADNAREEFNRIFSQRKLPSEIPVVNIGPGEHSLIEIIVKVGFAPSLTQARKLYQAGAVRLNDHKHPVLVFKADSLPMILRVGKRQFCKLEV